MNIGAQSEFYNKHKKKQAKEFAEINIMRKQCGLPLLVRKIRKCLDCGQRFLSNDNGERMCEKCSKR